MVYNDEWVLQDGKYVHDRLIFIGWLLCYHSDKKTQRRELWDIINPDSQKKTIPHATLKQTYDSLMHVAITVNRNILKNMRSADNKHDVDSSLEYLATCEKNMDTWFYRITAELNQQEVEYQ